MADPLRSSTTVVTLESLYQAYDQLQSKLDINKVAQAAGMSKPDDFALYVLKEAFEMMRDSSVHFFKDVTYGNLSSQHSLKDTLRRLGLSNDPLSLERAYDLESSVEGSLTAEQKQVDKSNALSSRNRPDGVLVIDFDNQQRLPCKGLVVVEIDGFEKVPKNLMKTSHLSKESASKLHALQSKALQGVDLCRQMQTYNTIGKEHSAYFVRINAVGVDQESLNKHANLIGHISNTKVVQQRQAEEIPPEILAQQADYLRALYCIDVLFKELLWVAILIVYDMYDNSTIQKKLLQFSSNVTDDSIFDYFFFVNFQMYPVSHFETIDHPDGMKDSVFKQFSCYVDPVLFQNSTFLQQVNPRVGTINIRKTFMPSYLVYVQRVNIKNALQWLEKHVDKDQSANEVGIVDHVMTDGMWYIADVRDMIIKLSNIRSPLVEQPHWTCLGITEQNGDAKELGPYYDLTVNTDQKKSLKFRRDQPLSLHFQKYSKTGSAKYYSNANLQIVHRFVNVFENKFWAMHKHLEYEPTGWTGMQKIMEVLRMAARRKELALIQRSAYPLGDGYDENQIPTQAAKKLTTRLIQKMCVHSEELEDKMKKYLLEQNIPYSIAFFRILGCRSLIMLHELAKQHTSSSNPRIVELMKFFPVATQSELSWLFKNVTQDLNIFIDQELFYKWVKNRKVYSKSVKTRLSLPWVTDELVQTLHVGQTAEHFYMTPIGYKVKLLYDDNNGNNRFQRRLRNQVARCIENLSTTSPLYNAMTAFLLISGPTDLTQQRELLQLYKVFLKDCLVEYHITFFMHIIVTRDEDLPLDTWNELQVKLDIKKHQLHLKNEAFYNAAPGAWPLRDINRITVLQPPAAESNQQPLQEEFDEMTESEDILWQLLVSRDAEYQHKHKDSEAKYKKLYEKFFKEEEKSRKQLHDDYRNYLGDGLTRRLQLSLPAKWKDPTTELIGKMRLNHTSHVQGFSVFMSSMFYSVWEKISANASHESAWKKYYLRLNSSALDTTYNLSFSVRGETKQFIIPHQAVILVDNGIFIDAKDIETETIKQLCEKLEWDKDVLLKDTSDFMYKLISRDIFVTPAENTHKKTFSAQNDGPTDEALRTSTHNEFVMTKYRTRDYMEWYEVDSAVFQQLMCGHRTDRDFSRVVAVLLKWKRLLIIYIFRDTIESLRIMKDTAVYKNLLLNKLISVAYTKLEGSDKFPLVQNIVLDDLKLTGNSVNDSFKDLHAALSNLLECGEFSIKTINDEVRVPEQRNIVYTSSYIPPAIQILHNPMFRIYRYASEDEAVTLTLKYNAYVLHYRRLKVKFEEQHVEKQRQIAIINDGAVEERVVSGMQSFTVIFAKESNSKYLQFGFRDVNRTPYNVNFSTDHGHDIAKYGNETCVIVDEFTIQQGGEISESDISSFFYKIDDVRYDDTTFKPEKRVYLPRKYNLSI